MPSELDHFETAGRVPEGPHEFRIQRFEVDTRDEDGSPAIVYGKFQVTARKENGTVEQIEGGPVISNRYDLNHNMGRSTFTRLAHKTGNKDVGNNVEALLQAMPNCTFYGHIYWNKSFDNIGTQVGDSWEDIRA